jgi:hypothetical protein
MKLIIAALLIGLSMQSSFAMINEEKHIVDQMLILKRKQFEKLVADDVKLIKSASDINSLTYTIDDGITETKKPLIFKYCEEESYAPLLKVLLEKKANPNIDSRISDCGIDKNFQPLTNAIAYGALANVDLLLKYGANPNTSARNPKEERFSFEYTPLNLAIKYNEFDITELLLKHKVDPNFSDDSLPLTRIINYYCPDVEEVKKEVKERIALMEFFDPNLKDNQKYIDAKKNTDLDSLYKNLIEEDKEKARKWISLLMHYKADPNMIDPREKKSPLEIAQERGYANIVALMTSKTHVAVK